MRKISTLAATALIAVAANAENLFHEDFATQEAFALWTVIDNNQDDKTWTYDATGEIFKVYYTYHSANMADDWLISPAITIPAKGSYLVSYDVMGSSYGEALEVWTGNGATPQSMTSIGAAYSSLDATAATKSFLTDFEEGQTAHIGFHAVTPADKWRLSIGNISVRYIETPADLGIKAITSPATGENLAQENVTVTVENSGRTDITSYTLRYTLSADGKELQAVTENITTTLKAGEQTEYTFQEKADLSTPRTAYTLTVTAVAADDINPDNDTRTAEIRHIAAATVPYFMGFETSEDTSNISTINANDDQGDWNINYDSWFSYFAHTGSACMAYNYDSENAADDWFFIDPLALEAGYYCLKFWYSALDNHPERLRVCYGTAPTPEAMTNTLAEYNPVDNSNYLESISIFQVPDDGKYYIGFYAFSDANENWLLVDDISIEKIDPEAADVEITAFKEPFDFWRAPNRTAASIEARNIGIVDVTADVLFYVDGTLAIRQSETILAQQVKTISIPDAIAGLSAGTHEIKVEIDYPLDSKPENNSVAKTLVVLPSPVAIWDFENTENVGTTSLPHYKLPEELTFRAEDSYTVHPDAGAEFEEHGWGIFSLEHFMLGTRALAGCSWFTQSGTADRWVVLPKVKVTGDNAWFVWDANSYNPTYLEDYRVKVSDGEDKWSDYNTEASIDGETTEVKTRGIDLAKYKDKEIHIAVNLVSYNCEALILDNLALYGDIEYTLSAISTPTAAEQTQILVDHGTLRVISGAQVLGMTVYNISGATIAATNESTIDITAIPAGVYIVKAETTDGIATLKFTR